MLAEGRYPHKRTLRKHDELKVFYHQFLHVVDVLRQRDQEQVVRLEDAVARMRAVVAHAAELAPAISALEIEVKARRQALADAAPAAPPVASR